MSEIIPKIIAGEQRLTMLLMGYWQETRGEDGRCPSADDFFSVLPDDLLDDCFVFVPGKAPGAGKVTDIGDKIARASGLSAKTRQRAKLRPDTLLTVASKWVDRVVDTAMPVLDEGEFNNPDGGRSLYRTILLPLRNDRGKVVQVLGGARRKVVE